MLNIDYVVVSVLGGWYVMTGAIQIGQFQAFITYTRMFTSPFQQVLGIMNTIMSALASAERIYRFLDEPEIVEFGTSSLDPTTIDGDVEFENVFFAYVPRQAAVRRYIARCPARSADRDRRTHRRGQDDPRQPAHALL